MHSKSLTAPTTNASLFIYIDNSNLFLQGQKTYAQTHKHMVSTDPTWRVDIGRLKTIVIERSTLQAEANFENVAVNLYGSYLSSLDPVWTVIESHKIDVSKFSRSYWTGREKQIDTSIIADSVDQAATSYFQGTMSEFIFVSGDIDLNAAVLKIVERGFTVHVWSWKNCVSAEYLTQEHEQGVQVHFLDEHLDKIGFRESTFRLDQSSMSPYGIVVLDPLPKAAYISEVISKLNFSVYRHERRSPRADGSGSDMIIIPTTWKGINSNELNSTFQNAKIELEKHGLVVMTYVEYSQSNFKPRENNLTNPKRFEKLADPQVDAIGHSAEGGGGFIEINRNAKQYNIRLKKNQEKERIRCQWRGYCQTGTNCKFGHTDEEKKVFLNSGPKKAKRYKLCTNLSCSRGPRCAFAHGKKELFCPTCGATGAGHEMKNCPKR